MPNLIFWMLKIQIIHVFFSVWFRYKGIVLTARMQDIYLCYSATKHIHTLIGFATKMRDIRLLQSWDMWTVFGILYWTSIIFCKKSCITSKNSHVINLFTRVGKKKEGKLSTFMIFLRFCRSFWSPNGNSPTSIM